MRRRGFWLVGSLCVLGSTLFLAMRPARTSSPPVLPASGPVEPALPSSDDRGPGSSDDGRAHEFRVPAGDAPALSCDEARAIVIQSRTELAYQPETIDAKAFADAAADWLDPYGLWSVAPDTPVADAFDAHAAELLADLESTKSRGCPGAQALGGGIVTWVDELRGIFDEARASAQPGEDLGTEATAPAFEGSNVTRPARALAATLGRRVGVVERSLGAAAQPYVDAARSRYFPRLDASGWARVVLASAVRAYVPAIDPHGAWAPLDEESSVYEVDLEARPPVRLWDKSDRTAIGVRIESGAAPPLADGDVVLSLAGLPTAGLSYEQNEQLGFAASEARPPAQAIVLRAGEKLPVTTWLDGAPVEARPADPVADDDDLPVERFEYGEGDVAVVAIHDVRDDLGDELTRALLHQREHAGRALAGVVLDLRGNGGGSTDGAIDALGVFIPGAALFPMKRRDGSLETDRAPEPPSVDRWRGPVAALVDADTASAAEMIAGALVAYRRGPTVGTTTFGKGCAQEYVDDDAHAGILRLTTLLYALPDGNPVQRVGLAPTLRFPFAVADANDREASLAHAPPTWRGPDVRDRAVLGHSDDGTWTVAWPANGGNVGPCKDSDTCRALRLLGSPPTTARRQAHAKGR
ncbi:MAG TPA: S41 family peptidase [Polyangiaceae bacterium]|jgi:carboxyl-terminal processing protease